MDQVTNDFVTRFKTYSIIGKGESCIVRHAYDEITKSHVALKFIDLSNKSKSVRIKKSLIETTKKEIEILDICRGVPNIVQLIDHFFFEAYFVLCFERYSVDLFEYTNQNVTLDEWLTSKLSFQLISALDFLHSSKIIHRDIKAENILLSSNMDLYISDFGISISWKDTERFFEVTGTVGYMAPEMISLSLFSSKETEGYHKEIDLWALGILVYILLIGYPPFWNDDQVQLMKSIVEEDYNRKLLRYKYLSSEAKELIASLLVKNPKIRSSIEEIKESKFCKIHQKKSRELYLSETDINDDFDINTLVTVENPYSLSIIRNIVDTSSFSIYNHWVSQDNSKKHRASLYQTDNTMH